MTTIALERTAGVVKATAEKSPALARMLARAFEHDPAMRWFLPDDSSRVGRLERMFAEIALPDTLVHEETYTTNELDGAALWVPPGVGETGFLDTVRLVPLVASIFGGRTARALRGLAFMESSIPRSLTTTSGCWAFRPSVRGRAWGVRC